MQEARIFIKYQKEKPDDKVFFIYKTINCSRHLPGTYIGLEELIQLQTDNINIEIELPSRSF